MSKTYNRSIAGIILIIVSIPILWLNEGAMDIAKVARSSVPLSTETFKTVGGRRLVSITGILTTLIPISDGEILRPGQYVRLVRKTETFVRDKVKGKIWTAESKTFGSPTARIGVYTVDPQMMAWPPPIRLFLSKAMLALDQNRRLEGNFIYSGKGKLISPRFGDVRVSFYALGSQEVTAFGKQERDFLAPYVTLEYKFYRTFFGSRDEAIATLPAEHRGRLWAFRFIGCLVMWLGLSFFSLQLKRVRGLFPALEDKRVKPSFISFAAALVISALIVIIIIYNIYFWLLISGLAIAYFFYKRRKNAK
ncbi:hypothetical protein A2625_01325 [candidate division WOR-1 bacterium RIFCSPHIGHO2_01_FULL_53_15]|uniref:Uncharacterized protein n=1 Tax=candidate division WOR-1 bacterium RIFCSPHIGHO2_01_FULL_53_15 TaxID=1802564 RepID=A0A1F4Q128_UNCSA|nr:MAG: hypothetical protein A2625_01325 [candidate division WOR-1 bacterium RIFCSPHIGHO2_01_FULL_53_15]OGC13012.1 MAG: hypothetical protein A3D23_04030 [candidate division WOR-1 bacterium RIFCSPHIGHO2_02_FULL_53_26]